MQTTYKSSSIFYFIRLLPALWIAFGLLFSVTVDAQKKQYVVVLDAGHGGSDPGKVGYKGLKEKDIALKITKLVGAKLAKDPSIKVVYTRSKDVFVNLWKRGRIANKANADLFVSIHCNAHTSQASGAETWVLGVHANKQNFEVAKRENAVILLEDNYKEVYKGFNPNSPESVIGLTVMQEENLDKSLLLASAIQNNFQLQLKRKNRGVKQAGFVVLHQTYMPSVLIETGFITNKQEGRYLNSSKGQAEISSAISTAVAKYVRNLKANTIIADVVKDKVVPKKKAVAKKANKPKPKTIVSTGTEVTYKVQIASSKKKIRTKSYNFKGLSHVERVKVGRYYKYYYGNSNSFEQTKKALIKAKNKGYASAFIAAFKNGKKISVKEALKS